MPMYVFECNFCEYKFEKLVDYDTVKTECPRCNYDAFKDFGASATFAAHGLPNGHIGARA